MNIIEKIRNGIRRIRRYFITKSAESYYQRMAQTCRDLHKETGLHHYIVIDPMSGGRIVITNRRHFRAVKRAINDSGARMLGIYGEGTFTCNTMFDVQKGSFFSTLLEQQLRDLEKEPNASLKYMKDIRNDIEARRRAYVKWTLEHADKGSRAERRKRREEEKVIRRELAGYKKKRKNK